MHQTSRRKKPSSSKDSEEPTTGHPKDSKKEGKDRGSKTDKSNNRQSGNRKDKNSLNSKSRPDGGNGSNSLKQEVQPLMEIQTGNWQDTEASMINGSDQHFGTFSDFSNRDKLPSRRGSSYSAAE